MLSSNELYITGVKLRRDSITIEAIKDISVYDRYFHLYKFLVL